MFDLKIPFNYVFDDSKISCRFKLDSYVTFIIGDSSTGKTFILKRIQRVIKEKSLRSKVKTNISIDKTFVCLDEHDIKEIAGLEGCIIFIDRFDMLNNAELEKMINSNKNLFVIMYRGGKCGIRTNLDNIKELTSSKSNSGRLTFELKRVL